MRMDPADAVAMIPVADPWMALSRMTTPSPLSTRRIPLSPSRYVASRSAGRSGTSMSLPSIVAIEPCPTWIPNSSSHPRIVLSRIVAWPSLSHIPMHVAGSSFPTIEMREPARFRFVPTTRLSRSSPPVDDSQTPGPSRDPSGARISSPTRTGDPSPHASIASPADSIVRSDRATSPSANANAHG